MTKLLPSAFPILAAVVVASNTFMLTHQPDTSCYIERASLNIMCGTAKPPAGSSPRMSKSLATWLRDHMYETSEPEVEQ